MSDQHFCQSCGAPEDGARCSYCGSELPLRIAVGGLYGYKVIKPELHGSFLLVAEDKQPRVWLGRMLA